MKDGPAEAVAPVASDAATVALQGGTHGSLGPLPSVSVEIVEDLGTRATATADFLRVRRLVLQNRSVAGAVSRPYRYDVVERDCLDAVGIVLYARREVPYVCLRSALRPPLALRSVPALFPPERSLFAGWAWEIPAGLLERGEEGFEGQRRCAVRETREEVGLTVSADALSPLGHPIALSAGVLGEQLVLFCAEVDPSSRSEPPGDGGPVEENAFVRFVPLSVALDAVRSGVIADAKTETALRRLEDHLTAINSPQKLDAESRGVP